MTVTKSIPCGISLRERLAELLALKDRKDTIGKDIEYLRRQPLAWEAARAALASPDTKEGTA